jgi:1-acyl-sn-glycerol-3-phosphate acyltransferase
MMNVHMPAMEKRIIPEMNRKLKREPRPLAPYATLASLVEGLAQRYEFSVALQRVTADGLTRTCFADVKRASDALAARLESAGIGRGDRVALVARNRPEWGMACFGIVRSGAAALPIDPSMDADTFRDLVREARVRAIVCDGTLTQRGGAVAAAIGTGLALAVFDLDASLEDDGHGAPSAEVRPDDVALVALRREAGQPFEYGEVTHGDLTSLVASLSPLFPLAKGDAMLSLLPLHHMFELVCGLVLPLSRGVRVAYMEGALSDGVVDGLEATRAKAVVCVPAVWQVLESRILQQAGARGPLARAAFDAAIEANGWLTSHLGFDLGGLLFGRSRAQLGGELRWLISGGAPMPEDMQKRIAGLGLGLRENLGADAPLFADGAGEPPALAAVAPTPVAPSSGEGVSWDRPIVLPQPVQAVGKALIGRMLDFFYGDVMNPVVLGRGHIPHNRNVIVVANHASHLDMGFVRYALGEYGEDIVSLAAQDYFFESGLKKAFFENLTNLKAIDRRASLRQSIRQASQVIEQGRTVLIFPEGTRSATGEIQEFKPLVGYLALTHSVDILPIHLGGTHAAMSKGAAVPTRRDIVARIGPPLCARDLRRVTREMTVAQAAREVARIARSAVLALAEGQVLDLSRVGADDELAPERVHPLVRLFSELEARFRAGEVERPLSYYVSLGSDELAKWTVRVDSQACDVRPGKPDGGRADCVLKTSPEIFTKIVRESYVPSPADFLSGAIKSNDVGLLVTFQRVFQLDQAS